MNEENSCPFCGAVNLTNSSFCLTCGANLEVKNLETTNQSEPIQAEYITPPQYQQPFYQQSTYYAPKYPIVKNKFTPIVIISLILSIVSIAVFSWLPHLIENSWIWRVTSTVTVLGIILSAIAIKDNKIVGITGIILCILSLLAQFIRIILWIAYYMFF